MYVCVSLPVHCARSVFKIAAQTTLMKTSTVKTTQQMRQQQRSVGLRKAFYSCSFLRLCECERESSAHRKKSWWSCWVYHFRQVFYIWQHSIV